jgi:hypothetical protein
MAKMSRNRVEEIVAKELPGYRVLSKPSEEIDSRPVRRQAEASSPEIGQLMRKFGIDEDNEVDSGWSTDARPNGDAVDDEIVLVEKMNPIDPLSRAHRPKAKVISERGTVKGSQG